MPETTNTLATLRRAIASELQMPFARRFDSGTSKVGATSTATKIIDANLSQRESFWNGNWFYHPATGSLSLIRAFTASDHSFQLEIPVSATPATDDLYEIHSIFNAADIRKAINRSIVAASRVFSDSVTDQTLVVQENVLTYPLSSLTKVPWIISKVWIENKPMMRGMITAAGSTTFTTNSPLSLAIPTNYILSIYAGTGAGQQRNVLTYVGSSGTVAAWNVIPDTTSKFAMWDSTYEMIDWLPLSAWHLDAKEYPSILYINRRIPSRYGSRIRLEYLAVPSGLVAETDTTIVPSEYIIPKAVAILFGQRMRDTKVDRDTFAMEQQKYDDEAEKYLLRNIPQKPDVTMKSPIQTEIWNEEDPLGWNGM